MNLHPGDIPMIEDAAAKVQEAADKLNAAILSAVAVGLSVQVKLSEIDCRGCPGKSSLVTAHTVYYVGFPERYAEEGKT